MKKEKNSLKQEKLLEFLRKNTFLTIGCTDPIGIALAVAWAKSVIDGDVLSIKVIADKNIIKNAFAVKIPGVGEGGIELAAALGYISGVPEKGLLLLGNISNQEISQAKQIVGRKIVTFETLTQCNSIHIEAIVETNKGVARALLTERHDHLAGLWLNNTLIKSSSENLEINNHYSEFNDVPTIEEMIEVIEKIDTNQYEFLYEGVTTNMEAAEYGLKLGDKDLAVGSRLQSFYKEVQDTSFIGKVRVLTGAAADTRMSGQTVPITGCFGSGNHGITLFIALGLLGESLKKDKETLLKALCLAELLTGYVKNHTGILTPHCGCSLAAGIGAAGGGAYLLGGNSKQILNAINLVTATLFGTICDGAKETCALKISNAAGIAIESSFLAVSQNAKLSSQGVVGKSFLDTLANIKNLTEKGYSNLDVELINVLKV